MVDESSLRCANDRQTEKAFSITKELYDKGFPSAVGGGCARRHQGWCLWMNDADMLTTAPNEVVESVLDRHKLSILTSQEHMVAGYDNDGLYEVCCWKGQGTDTSVFSKHPMNWRFEHRALALDARTRQPIEQPGGVQNKAGVNARYDQVALFSQDPYMCYNALSFACREDIAFDETLMTLMREKAHVNFFVGLFFKVIAKVLVGRSPSKGMDRLMEANAFYYLPNMKEAWSTASIDVRKALDNCSYWILPWIILMRAHPAIEKDMLRIFFPEKWITYYRDRPIDVFPLLDESVRQRESWTYWQVRRMMSDLANPPEHIRASPAITDRITPFPFP